MLLVLGSVAVNSLVPTRLASARELRHRGVQPGPLLLEGGERGRAALERLGADGVRGRGGQRALEAAQTHDFGAVRA